MNIQARIEEKKSLLLKINEQKNNATDKVLIWRQNNRLENLKMDIEDLLSQI